MKRLLFFICTLLCANVIFAQTRFWVGNLQYEVTEADEVEVHAASTSITIAAIPSTVNYYGTTYSVTSIGSGAFYNCSSLTSVNIPTSVTSIGTIYDFYGAFAYCSSLTSVTIPNSVTSIGWKAFLYCSSLTSVTIPNSVTYIGDEAFGSCSSLTSVTIGNSVDTIGSGAFSGCSSLTSITIPNSVTSIGSWAFSGCSSLTSVNIPNSVTSIYQALFQDCSSLTSITIPNSVTYIGPMVFEDCSSLTSINIPNSVTSIGYWAFYNCSSLTSITIPNSVDTIESSTFYNCSSLTSINIPNSVTTIGSSAFEDCSSLASVTIGNSVTSIGNDAFYNCDSLTSLNFNAINCEDFDHDYYYHPFYNCPITTINIGNSVQRIPNRFARNLDSLTSVTIGNSVTSIGNYAFYNCSGLTSVNIPNSVTSIGNGAFYDCSSLTSVTIGNSVTSIGEEAFYNCDSLTSVTIPNSVTSIGEYAFYHCRSLRYVTCLADIPPTLGYNVFYLIPGNKILNVNCGLRNDYISSWGYYFNSNNIQEITFDIDTYVNNEIEGSIEIERNNCSTATLTATANNCYQFVSWNDGNTENPRIIELTNDTSFTAIFEELPNHNYNVNVSINNDAFGSVSIENDCNSSTLTATANNCYQFVSWNDGNTENPRVVNVSSDTSLTAIFEDFNTELSATICQGQVYNENGFNVSEAGVYTQTLTSANGCDSIVTLTLNVNPIFDTTINATINAGETYAEFGFNESEAGTYVQNLQTEFGCDSTITLVLSVNSSLLEAETESISFFPNPTKSEITFSQAIEKIEVIDLTGKTILTFTNAKTINIESLPAGAYYLRLTNEEKTSLQKVIKQ